APERLADDPGGHPLRAVARLRRSHRGRAAALALRARPPDHDRPVDVRARPDVRDRAVDAPPRRRRAGRAGAARGPAAPLARVTAAPAPVPIVVEGVSKALGAVQALLDVHLRVGAGEFLALIGPSGCGKTTLLKTIAGLARADAGRVTVGGRTVAGPGRECSVGFP